MTKPSTEEDIPMKKTSTRKAAAPTKPASLNPRRDSAMKKIVAKAQRKAKRERA
jgi:hypothetical protein